MLFWAQVAMGDDIPTSRFWPSHSLLDVETLDVVQLAQQLEAAEAASSSRKPRRRTQHAFQVLWCHERCHKQDAATLRAQLQLCSSQFGAELVCEKTSLKFQAWLQSRSKESKDMGYVLVSDWRQLKPCLECLEDLPAAVVVLCDQPKTEEKAKLWNATRAFTTFPVYILQLQSDWTHELSEIFMILCQGENEAWQEAAPSSSRFSL